MRSVVVELVRGLGETQNLRVADVVRTDAAVPDLGPDVGRIAAVVTNASAHVSENRCLNLDMRCVQKVRIAQRASASPDGPRDLRRLRRHCKNKSSDERNKYSINFHNVSFRL